MDETAPEDPAGVARRSALEAAQARLWRRLEALSIQTRTVSHQPVFTVAQSKAMRGTLPGGHCKSLFLRDKRGRQYLVVTLEDRAVDLKALRRPLAAGNLSFASADRLMATLGVVPGAVTPLALVNATPAVAGGSNAQPALTVGLDRAMLDRDPLNFHPLSNDATTAIAPHDLVRFIRACGYEPLAIDFAADPPTVVQLPSPGRAR